LPPQVCPLLQKHGEQLQIVHARFASARAGKAASTPGLEAERVLRQQNLYEPIPGMERSCRVEEASIKPDDVVLGAVMDDGIEAVEVAVTTAMDIAGKAVFGNNGTSSMGARPLEADSTEMDVEVHDAR